MTGAIILAAGRSSRMGSPKALLEYRGSTFVATIIDACRSAGFGPIVVVLGAEADKIMHDKSLGNVKVATNLRLDSGPIGSLAVGIDIINHMVDGVLVWPVDQPSVASETLRRLVNGFRTSQASVVVPTHDGRRGHPVLIRAALFAEIPRAVKAGRTLRDVIRSEPTSVFEVAADDAAILQDIDTPMDYEALRRRITD